MEVSWVFALVFVAILIISGLLDSGVPKAYRARSCAGKKWRYGYPHASKQSIRQFLAMFASAFAIKAKHALQFEPEDELMSIYRSRYPSQLTPDALEFETLAMDLEKEHGLLLSNIWHEHLTLGELFAHVSAAQPSVRADAPKAARRST
ncbi:MAG: hypothetical protein HY016_04510 [Nitrosomonadales bacterium]|nr:hypothetical protein [Nitrosomonadales bacterium]